LDELGFAGCGLIFKDDKEGYSEVVIGNQAIAELNVTDKVANAGARNYYCMWV
jgi:hypothetical protein